MSRLTLVARVPFPRGIQASASVTSTRTHHMNARLRPHFAPRIHAWTAIALLACIDLAPMAFSARFAPKFLNNSLAANEWQAAAGSVKITPAEPIWMAGYGSRNKPAEGLISDLFAKVLVLRDPQGHQGVVLTLDLVGIDRKFSQSLCARLEKELSIQRHQVALCASHTHSGPVVGRNLAPMHYELIPPDQQQKVDAYAAQLEAALVQLVAGTIPKLEPVDLSWDSGTTSFAVNRRNNNEAKVTELRTLGQLQGPFDHDVPVLAVRGKDGKLRSVLFGYACHATVLSLYDWCADYPGFAQAELEQLVPGCVALFWAGCGADQNPLPRREVDLARKYGRQLAHAVKETLDRPMHPVSGQLLTQYAEVPIAFDAIPTRDYWVKEADSTTAYVAARARMMLRELDAGRAIPTSYPYPVATWRIGWDVQWVVLGGEVVVDYALRLKRERTNTRTWVAGYSNDVMAYIPSVRVLLEGGYEGSSSQPLYGQPAHWAPSIENTIVREVHRQLGQ